MESLTTDRVYFDTTMPHPHVASFAGGRAAFFSQRCPTKDSANEDALGLLPTGPTSGILVVADGCGGMAQGEQAARIAIEALQEHLRRAGTEAADAHLRMLILDGMEAANRHVQELGGGAATTMAVVEVDGAIIRPYHVGDSAVLLMGNRGRLKLVTTSHSPVGYAVEAGVIDEHEAMHHEDRHLVSNVVGSPDAHIEIGSQRKMRVRDTILIGSDGLFDNLLIDEITEIARKGPLLGCAEQLASLATERMSHLDSELPGKPDDLTFILFRPN